MIPCLFYSFKDHLYCFPYIILLGNQFCNSTVTVMYASQMQNISAGRFFYGTGEEHTIHFLLKSKHNIANIFLQRIFGEAFTLTLKNKLYAKRLTVIPSLAVVSKRYLFILRSPLVVESLSLKSSIRGCELFSKSFFNEWLDCSYLCTIHLILPMS